jgi:hypothetical protein
MEPSVLQHVLLYFTIVLLYYSMYCFTLLQYLLLYSTTAFTALLYFTRCWPCQTSSSTSHAQNACTRWSLLLHLLLHYCYIYTHTRHTRRTLAPGDLYYCIHYFTLHYMVASGHVFVSSRRLLLLYYCSILYYCITTLLLQDMFSFLEDASGAYCKYFQTELESAAARTNNQQAVLLLLYYYFTTEFTAWALRHARMLTYAHVCSRMLTYAHVCSRMLTYAGSVECRAWPHPLPRDKKHWGVSHRALIEP